MAIPLLVLAMRTAAKLEAHPGLTVDPPGEYVYWTARQGGKILAAEPGLNALLDDLDRLLPGDVEPASMGRGPCSSSGYCSCTCRRCLGGQHGCGHRKNCHKACASR